VSYSTQLCKKIQARPRNHQSCKGQLALSKKTAESLALNTLPTCQKRDPRRRQTHLSEKNSEEPQGCTFSACLKQETS